MVLSDWHATNRRACCDLSIDLPARCCRSVDILDLLRCIRPVPSEKSDRPTTKKFIIQMIRNVNLGNCSLMEIFSVPSHSKFDADATATLKMNVEDRFDGKIDCLVRQARIRLDTM